MLVPTQREYELTSAHHMLSFSSGADVVVESVRGTKQLVGTVIGLTATDLGNIGTRFPRVLDAASSEDGNKDPLLIHLKYMSAADGATDNHLEIDVGPLQVVYFNQIGLEVIDYVCEGVLGSAITGTLRYVFFSILKTLAVSQVLKSMRALISFDRSADALIRQRALAKTAFTINIAKPRFILPRMLVSDGQFKGPEIIYLV